MNTPLSRTGKIPYGVRQSGWRATRPFFLMPRSFWGRRELWRLLLLVGGFFLPVNIANAQQSYHVSATGPVTNQTTYWDAVNGYSSSSQLVPTGWITISSLTQGNVSLAQDSNGWVPTSVSTPNSGSGTATCPSGGGGPWTWSASTISTLTAGGIVTTTVTQTSQGVFQTNEVVSETLDLNTGNYSWSDNDAGTCAGTEFYNYQSISGVLTITMNPGPPPKLSLAFLNPYACSINGSDCTAAPSSGGAGDVTSARAASAISADGQSAAVIVVTSTNATDPVQLTLSAQPGFSGLPIGSLSLYDPNFLTGASQQATGNTSLSIAPNPDYCDASGNCVFLALLWAPSTMSGGILSSATSIFAPVQLTITATQGTSNPTQTSILLQPPPLVLVHGIWSNAEQAWPGSRSGNRALPSFFNWLEANYPHKLIFTADYGPYSALEFSDPKIQGILSNTILNVIANAANQRVVARQVDVVAHSMGGLATRYFMETAPLFSISNPVHKLITIGTPHQGTPLATALDQNEGNLVGGPGKGAGAALAIASICAKSLPLSSPCTLSNLFRSQGKIIDGGVLSLEAGLTAPDNTQYYSIVGLKPTSPTSSAETFLNFIIHGFVSASQSVNSILTTPYSDTLVSQVSQIGSAIAPAALINDIVHTGETSSPSVWNQAAFWLMGGIGIVSAQSVIGAAVPHLAGANVQAQATAVSNVPPVLELTGFTQVSESNVSFSPASNSALTINSATTINAVSSTKTITEVLLFQTVTDPTDAPLLYSTESPFAITFTATRMGSTNFVAFAVFSDNTFATTTLNYTFQLSGSPLALNLANAPVGTLPVGSSAFVGAQALFSNGPVDVTEAASYKVRSGTNTVFSVDSSGVVVANGPGTDWLDVSYGGLIASAQVNVGSCTYSLSPPDQLVDSIGGAVTIYVTAPTGCSWIADIGGASWLMATTASGNGSGTITLVATPNATSANQKAIITVANRDAAVTQPATACTYTLSQTQITINPFRVNGTIGVTTSCPIIVSSSDPTWLVPTALTNSVAYTALANTGTGTRTATLNIGTQTVKIIQTALTVTITMLGSSTNPSLSGQSVTFTAIVDGAGGTPTGSVTFYDGANSLGTGTLVAGKTTLITSALVIGNHSITAQFGGDSIFAGSTSSPALVQVVNGKPSATALVSSLNPEVGGQSVTFTATVTSTVGGTPTGSVAFFNDSTALGTGAVTLNGSGVATLTTTVLAVGSPSITASYSGDANYAASASPAVSETVNVVGFAPSPTGLTVTAGQSLPISLMLYSAPGSGLNFTLSCSGAPAKTTCQFDSNSIAPAPPPNGSTVKLTFQTSSSELPPGPSNRVPWPWETLGISVALAALLAGTNQLRHAPRRRLALGMCLAVFALAPLLISCGGGGRTSYSPPPTYTGTPKGPATFTVSGTSGTTTISTKVTVTVQ
jgi:pimeloyl-ACP methyl ester carboxylesterase